MAAIVRDATPKVAGAKGGKALRGGKKALPEKKTAKPAIRGKGRIRMARPANTVAKPKGLRPGALAESRGVKTKKSKPKAGPGSLQAIATRRARVAKGIKEQDARLLQALRDGTYDSNRGSLERMARRRVTLSAANEIYNRQRTVAKISGKDLDRQLLSSPLAIMPTIRQSKDKREMAAQLRERARERVVKGRKGRR
jgi:hypothetical protein